MRLNKFIARATGKSRREADDLISDGRIKVNNKVARLGQQITEDSVVLLGEKLLILPTERTLVMLNKPIDYVSSRRAQAKNARTLYELLPPKFNTLKTIGRLDQNSSGLILLTDDGDLAFRMTHPKFAKTKIYLVNIDKPLAPLHQQMISDFGVDLADGKSQLLLEEIAPSEHSRDDVIDIPERLSWRVTMREGRNRQIRRTFAALGYEVTALHRTDFGNYHLSDLKPGQWKEIENVI